MGNTLAPEELEDVKEKLDACQARELKPGFQHDFVTSNLERIEQYGEGTFFSESQLHWVDVLYRQIVLGEDTFKERRGGGGPRPGAHDSGTHDDEPF